MASSSHLPRQWQVGHPLHAGPRGPPHHPARTPRPASRSPGHATRQIKGRNKYKIHDRSQEMKKKKRSAGKGEKGRSQLLHLPCSVLCSSACSPSPSHMSSDIINKKTDSFCLRADAPTQPGRQAGTHPTFPPRHRTARSLPTPYITSLPSRCLSSTTHFSPLPAHSSRQTRRRWPCRRSTCSHQPSCPTTLATP